TTTLIMNYVQLSSFSQSLHDGSADGNSAYFPQISADGTTVVFTSTTVEALGNAPFIFTYDLLTATTTLVTDNGENAVINGDGRYLAYDTNTEGPGNVYVYDLQTATTTLVSVSLSGTAGSKETIAPMISADGRYVLFDSYDTNLVANDPDGGGIDPPLGGGQLFLRDLQQDT